MENFEKIKKALNCCLMEPNTIAECEALGCPYCQSEIHCKTEMHGEIKNLLNSWQSNTVPTAKPTDLPGVDFKTIQSEIARASGVIGVLYALVKDYIISCDKDCTLSNVVGDTLEGLNNSITTLINTEGKNA